MSNTLDRGRGQDETTEAQAMSSGLDDDIETAVDGAGNASDGADPSKVIEEAIKVRSGPPRHIDDVASPAEELDIEAEFEALHDRHLLEEGETARAEVVGRLLEVMDDLQRVADTACDGTTTEALHQGVELVARKLTKTLADAGMEPVNPVDQRFDPNLHEALFMTLTGDPAQDEVVSEVVLIGYRIGERLLRPAQVGVFRYEEQSA